MDVEGEMAEETAELREVVQGVLLSELRQEAKAALAVMVVRAGPTPPRRTVDIEVCRIDVTQVSDIEQRHLSFRAKLFIQCKIIGGASDPDLLSTSIRYPLDPYRRPTHRPSAGWFLNQCAFQTSMGAVITEMSTVTPAGDDLLLNKRIEVSLGVPLTQSIDSPCGAHLALSDVDCLAIAAGARDSFCDAVCKRGCHAYQPHGRKGLEVVDCQPGGPKLVFHFFAAQTQIPPTV
eukprot:4605225-Prymnesium_polylepis.1